MAKITENRFPRIVTTDSQDNSNVGNSTESTGRVVFSGKATATFAPIEMTREDFMIMPRFVGTLNGEQITGWQYVKDEDATVAGCWSDNYEVEFINADGDFSILSDTGEDVDVELIDKGPRFITVHGLLQADAVYITGIPFWVQYSLIDSGCGLGLCVEGRVDGGFFVAYSAISLSANEDGSYTYFDANIMIDGDHIETWTIDGDTGEITGQFGGSDSV